MVRCSLGARGSSPWCSTLHLAPSSGVHLFSDAVGVNEPSRNVGCLRHRGESDRRTGSFQGLDRRQRLLTLAFAGFHPDFPGSALPLPCPKAGPLTTRQASLHAADCTFASPDGAFDAGLRPGPFFQTEPLACYRASWQLPERDLHRSATTSLSLSVQLYGITSNFLDARMARARHLRSDASCPLRQFRNRPSPP